MSRIIKGRIFQHTECSCDLCDRLVRDESCLYVVGMHMFGKDARSWSTARDYCKDCYKMIAMKMLDTWQDMNHLDKEGNRSLL